MKRTKVLLPAEAYTLVELLIVVAIVAILLALLLPTLSRSREQARQIKCLSNLKQIGTGTAAYLLENEMFPIGPREKLIFGDPEDECAACRYKTTNTTTCHWGGKRGLILHDSAEYKGEERQRRPLTKYLYKSYHWESNFERQIHGKDVTEFELFRCPSDRPLDTGSLFPETTDVPRLPIYEICGNSYYHNMHGEIHYRDQQPINNSSKIVFILEAPLYFQFETETNGRGWHRVPRRHNILFFDMHAANTEIDARQREGAEWTIKDTLSTRWYYE